MTRAILKLSGTTPVENEQLKSISNGLDRYVLRVFNSLVGILKGPEALAGFRLLIS